MKCVGTIKNEKSVSTDVLDKAAVRLAILCGLMAEAQYKREENKAGGHKDENCERLVWELRGWTGPEVGTLNGQQMLCVWIVNMLYIGQQELEFQNWHWQIGVL